MKIQVTFKRLPADTVSGEQVEIVQRYSSMDKLEIDDLEQWLRSKYGSGVLIGDCVSPAEVAKKQKQGIANAKARGLKFGRPSKQLPDNFKSVYSQYSEKKISLSQAAQLCGMPKSTFAYKAKHFVEE